MPDVDRRNDEPMRQNKITDDNTFVYYQTQMMSMPMHKRRSEKENTGQRDN